MNWLIPRGFKSSKICVGFRHKIVYLFRSSCGTRKEGLFFMTEVIKKLKLGIIKHYTKGNLAQVPIQFTRPEVLIWRDINEEILIFFSWKMWDPWMSECTTFTWLSSYGYSVKCTRFIFHFEFFCLRIYHTLKEKDIFSLERKIRIEIMRNIVFTGSRGKEIYRDCKSAFEDQFVTRVYSITSDQTKIWIFLYQFHVFLLFLQWITPGFRLANTRNFFYDRQTSAWWNAGDLCFGGFWEGHVYHKQKWK